MASSSFLHSSYDCRYRKIQSGLSGLQVYPALPSGSDAQRKDTQDSDAHATLRLGPIEVMKRRGLLPGYSRVQVQAVFRPPAVGSVREQISIAFRYGVHATTAALQMHDIYDCCNGAGVFYLPVLGGLCIHQTQAWHACEVSNDLATAYMLMH